MTINQAAKLWETNAKTVRSWIKRGKIPAERVRSDSSHRMVFQIPDDTPCPPKKVGVGGLIVTPAAEQRTLRKYGKGGYVQKYAGYLSIRHMARFLGISSDKVRAIYDDIVAKGGF